MRRHKPALDGQQEQRNLKSCDIRMQAKTLGWMRRLLKGSGRKKISKSIDDVFQFKERTVGL